MGDVGAVATVLDDVFKYFTQPDGYAQLSLEGKLHALHESSKAALLAKDWPAFDRITAELKRVCLETA